MSKDLPVYLFSGFLEAGKTAYIQETLEDADFNQGERTLLLLCEEGELEYDESRFATGSNVVIYRLENEADISMELLQQLEQQYDIERVLVEYNGMWMLGNLFEQLPLNWILYQHLTFVDARSIFTFNTNMRQLTYDKLACTELAIFNRFAEGMDKEAYHKLVRGASRRAAIIYEYEDGSLENDDIVDPLPFDIEAPLIEIKEEDYALWYRDISEDMQKYDGKTVSFRAMVSGMGKLPPNMFLPGRYLMTCCEDDIRFAGLICEYPVSRKLKNRTWVQVQAQIKIMHHQIYGTKGPVLKATSVRPAAPADPELATFY